MTGMGTTFKVLSIDGGGIRGTYVLEILDRLTQYLPAEKTWHDNFDLIVGTSTGGIIAAGLAYGITIEKLKGMYINECPKVFTLYPDGVLDRIAVGLLRLIRISGDCVSAIIHPKYTSNELRKLLLKLFGEKKLSDALTRLTLPAYDMTNNVPYLFEHPRSHNKPISHDVHIVDAVLATAAAPIYFPMHSITFNSATHQSTNYFADGGLWANNPALIGLTEAYKFRFKNPESNIMLLSIGTANQLPEAKQGNMPWINDSVIRNSGVFWLRNLLPVTFTGQAMGTEYFVNHIKDAGQIDYCRINHISEGIIQLDDCISNDQLIKLAEDTELSPELKRFFE